jgi:hypothetical protein
MRDEGYPLVEIYAIGSDICDDNCIDPCWMTIDILFPVLNIEYR